MNGILIYNQQDYERNSHYADWLMDCARDQGLQIELVFAEDLFKNGLNQEITFAINRSRSYQLSMLLELNDIRVFNQSSVTLLGNNKTAAYWHAKKNDVPFSPVLLNSKSRAPIISKPIHGFGGGNVKETNTVSDLQSTINQEKVTNLVGDIRFYIVNNQIIHAVIRKNNGELLSNFNKTNHCEIFNYAKEHQAIVEQFMTGLNIDYAGVDFFLTEDGKLLFNELEDVVGSRMLSHLNINNTTELLINHIKQEIT
ncbi:ATP-grasp domain-containing protein [Piscibacillus sp. B03]|uniref:ATP-grasp domain-containing protein n=1 Tax=Piscibacillus sp. B03 TaxID=3457430 RepID=UPI003FCEBD99